MVKIQLDSLSLEGNLIIPEDASGIVLFAHGSGSSRLSPRNRYVAEELNRAGIATLLFDLLTTEEEAEDLETGHLRFDINFLADRLVKSTEWVLKNPKTKNFKIGYFGASTGAAASFVAASRLPEKIEAIVSRGGRPDLAISVLDKIFIPTLLIVGGEDDAVLAMNEETFIQIEAIDKKIEVIPGASHLFEESGALEEVARLAIGWFRKYLK